MVTPPPAQLEIPLWVAGEHAVAVAQSLDLPVVADTPADVDCVESGCPRAADLTGDVDADRQAVIEWSSAGATHLLCALAGSANIEALVRWLQPEVAMVEFPRVVTETPLPAPWPRAER